MEINAFEKAALDLLMSRYKSLLDDIIARSVRVQSESAKHMNRIRCEVDELNRSFCMLAQDLTGRRRPQAGDRATGTITVDTDLDRIEYVNMYGTITASDELGDVRVRFDRFEYDDYSDQVFVPQPELYLGPEFQTHASVMELNEQSGWWLFDVKEV